MRSGEKNTAVVRAGAIGDLIQVLPALKKYKQLHPDEHITLICGESCLDAIRNTPYADSIFTFDDRKIYKGTLTAKCAETFKIIKYLRSFGKCFLLHTDIRWTLLPVLSGTPLIFNIRHVSAQNREERYMQCLTGSTEGYYKNTFHPDECAVKIPEKPYIAVAAGGARNIRRDDECRRWTGFRELSEKIIENTDHRLVFIGLTDDSPEIESDRVTDICGMTSLSDAYHIIKNSEMFIGNDSGLLHLAESTDTFSIGIFTASDPAEVLKNGSNTAYVSSALPCSPCERNGKFSRKCRAECVENIKTDEVFDIIMKRLEAQR